jgi:hypothetical protein
MGRTISVDSSILCASLVEWTGRVEWSEVASVTSYNDLPSLLIITEYEWSVPDGLQQGIKAIALSVDITHTYSLLSLFSSVPAHFDMTAVAPMPTHHFARDDGRSTPRRIDAALTIRSSRCKLRENLGPR